MVIPSFFSRKVIIFCSLSLLLLTKLSSLPRDLEALLHDHKSNARYAKQELCLSAAKAVLSWYIEHRFSAQNNALNKQDSDKQVILRLMKIRDFIGLFADCYKVTRAPVHGTLSLAASCSDLYKTCSLDEKNLQEKDVIINKLLVVGELVSQGYAVCTKTTSFTDLAHKDLMNDAALFARLLRGENDSLKYMLMGVAGLFFVSDLAVAFDIKKCDQVLSDVYGAWNNNLNQDDARRSRDDYYNLIGRLQNESSSLGYSQSEVQSAFRDALSELIYRIRREEDRVWGEFDTLRLNRDELRNQRDHLRVHNQNLQSQNQDLQTRINELTNRNPQGQPQHSQQSVQQDHNTPAQNTPSASQRQAATPTRPSPERRPYETIIDNIYAEVFGLRPLRQATQPVSPFGSFINQVFGSDNDFIRILEQTERSATIREQERQRALNRRDELNARATELPTVQIAEVNGQPQFVVRRAPPAGADDSVQPVERPIGVLPLTQNNPRDLAAADVAPEEREILVLACNDLLEAEGQEQIHRCPSCSALRIPQREAMLRIDPLSREVQQTHWRQDATD